MISKNDKRQQSLKSSATSPAEQCDQVIPKLLPKSISTKKWAKLNSDQDQ